MPRYSETEARCAVAASLSYAETLRRLELCATGGNWRTLRLWIDRWGIATDHFDSRAAQREGLRRRPQPLEEIMVEGSTYSRNHLKDRLYREGLKARRCEICGQGEMWRGRPMGLVLDHINGSGTTTGSTTCRSCAPTARPPSTRIAAARTGSR